jgi:hypothetical protein
VQLVRISGPTEPMRRLGDVAGLNVERTSARRLVHLALLAFLREAAA